MYRIGIDLGGTKIAAGIVDESYQLLASDSVPTGLPKAAGQLADEIRQLTDRLLEARGITFEEIASAGIGIPGTVNQATGMVEYANNFGFDHVPFLTMLKDRFPCKLYGENDAKAAAWAEYRAGAGKGSASMIMITLGTGVGGGIILNERLWDGINCAAGEIGHMVIERGGRPCTCGRRGCFEAYASAGALVRSAREKAERVSDSLMNWLCGEDPAKLDGRMILEAVKKGDRAAEEVFREYTEYLAEGTANLINIFQPERVCIGGGLSGAGDALLVPLRELVMPLVYSRTSERNTEILAAQLGNDAGIIGAACLDLLH